MPGLLESHCPLPLPIEMSLSGVVGQKYTARRSKMWFVLFAFVGVAFGSEPAVRLPVRSSASDHRPASGLRPAHHYAIAPERFMEGYSSSSLPYCWCLCSRTKGCGHVAFSARMKHCMLFDDASNETVPPAGGSAVLAESAAQSRPGQAILAPSMPGAEVQGLSPENDGLRCVVSKPVFTLKGDLAPTLSCDYLVVGPEHAGYAVELAPLVDPTVGTGLAFQPGHNRTAVLCLFGVIARGGAQALQTIKARIYDVLEAAGFSVTTYIFNVDVGDTKVDGKHVPKDFQMLPFNGDVFEEELQIDIDHAIDAKCGSNLSECGFRRRNYPPPTVRNAMRQMYSEMRVGQHLFGSNADVAVVCGPDFYVANDISLAHINEAVSAGSDSLAFVYTAQVNDAEGYTNGLYIGKPRAVADVTRHRFSDYKSSPHDYEHHLKQQFVRYGVQHRSTDTVFFKLRSDGKAEWQGEQRTDAVTLPAVRNNILRQFNAFQSRAPARLTCNSIHGQCPVRCNCKTVPNLGRC